MFNFNLKSMAKIESRPSFRAKLGYTTHDMSRDVVTSSPLSMLLPVYFDFLNPGESVKFSTTMFTRTEPLVKPAFVRCHEHVDWFFVPIEQLYSQFSSVFYGISDVNTSLIDVSDLSKYFPGIDLVTVWDDLFYQNLDPETQTPISELEYSPYAVERDGMNVPHIHSWQRLFQLMGLTSIILDPGNHLSNVPGHISQQRPTAFFFAAYQKIFMDHYRLDDWEANDPKSYSLDQYYRTGIIDTYDGLEALFKVHYAPLNKEYFTNVMPSPLVGAGSISGFANGLTSGNIDIRNWQQPSTSSLLQLIGADSFQHEENNSSPTGIVPVNPDGSGGFVNKMTPANFRGMFALEKLLEITRRAGKHYDKQTLAHFGVDVPEGLAGECFKLGSDHNEIDFNEVVSQANTVSGSAGSALGDLAGKGVGGSRGELKEFKAPCHGILMAIHYVKADTYYSADQHFDKVNAIAESADLYHPEFDNLGMQPIFGFEQYYAPFGLLAGDPVDTWNNTITAWQYRYSQWKTKYDVVSGKFLYGENTAWIPTRSYGLYTQNINRYYQNPQFLDGIFQVNFNYPTDPTPSDPSGTFCSRDPFEHYMRFNVYKTSSMSTYSLPKLNA